MESTYNVRYISSPENSSDLGGTTTFEQEGHTARKKHSEVKILF